MKKVNKPMKVFCKNCKYLSSDKIISDMRCLNTKTWIKQVEYTAYSSCTYYLSSIDKINTNNNCKYFKRKTNV